MKTYSYMLSSLLLLSAVSCKKFVDVSPTDRTTKAINFENMENATSAVNGMYYDLAHQGAIYTNGLFTNIALMGDELSTNNILAAPFTTNTLSPQFGPVGSYWSGYYGIINHANLILDNVTSVPNIPATEMKNWTGEAKFIRATAYMGLVQLFGNVPLVTSSLWQNNETLPRSSTDQVYALVLQDLKDAVASLPHDYSDPNTDRLRATIGAANATLTQYYMLKKDWPNAVASATAVINDNMYQLETSYANIFTDNSVESILEIAFDNISISLLSNEFSARGGRGTTATYSPSPQVKAVFNASPGDARFFTSVGGGTINKYTTVTSRDKLLRLGDLYLLRAEAEAQLNNLTDALNDLNKIRTRAGVPPSVASDQASLLLAIENERVLELAFEGHRWFDLVRTGRANAIISVLKPATWKPTAVLMPVPQQQISLNPALLPQNPGY